jgi:outer membrane protein assembly factor BamD (BamD/ComL family)
MDLQDQPNPAQLLHNKAKAALALGEIYEANIHIRKAIELDANDANIALAKEIKYEMGKKALAKAQQYFEKHRYEDARDEAQKALQAMGSSEEAETILQAIEQREKRQKRGGKRMAWLISLALLGILVGLWVYYSRFSAEQSAWSQAQTANSFSAYELFLQQYPKGQFADDARQALKNLNEKDESLWQSAIHPPEKANLERYLLAMEGAGGIHIDDAKLLIDSLDFDYAVKEQNPIALENYVKNHPNGTYVASARKLMATLVTSDDLQQITDRWTQFYGHYTQGEFEKMLDFFPEITPRFMDKKDADHETLLSTFADSRKDVESEEISIDTAQFSVTKDTSGVFTCKFTLNTQRKVKKLVETTQKRGRRTVKKTETQYIQLYGKQAVEAKLDADLKITDYRVRLLGSRKEITNKSSD